MIHQQQYPQGYAMPTRHVNPVGQLGETATTYVFYFELPGIKAEEVEVMIQGQYLCIRGQYTPAYQDKGVTLVQSERLFGPFERTVTIPAPVDQDSVKAKLEDGILEIVLSKKEDTNPSFKKVDVNKGTSKGKHHTSS